MLPKLGRRTTALLSLGDQALPPLLVIIAAGEDEGVGVGIQQREEMFGLGQIHGKRRRPRSGLRRAACGFGHGQFSFENWDMTLHFAARLGYESTASSRVRLFRAQSVKLSV